MGYIFGDGSIFSGGSGIAVNPDTEAPSAPVLAAATNVTENSADLDWTDSVDNVGVLGYNVWLSTDGGNNYSLHASGVQVSQYDLTGLTQDQAHHVYVTAYDTSNFTASNVISFSTTASSDTTDPTVPAIAFSSKTHNSISFTISTLSTDAESGLKQYRVKVDGADTAQTIPSTAIVADVHTVSNLTPETAYSITIYAEDNVGNISADSNAVVQTTDTAPAAGQIWTGDNTLTTQLDYRSTSQYPATGNLLKSTQDDYLKYPQIGWDNSGTSRIRIATNPHGYTGQAAVVLFPESDPANSDPHTYYSGLIGRNNNDANLTSLNEVWFEIQRFIPAYPTWITHIEQKFGLSIGGINGVSAGNNPTTGYEMLFELRTANNNVLNASKYAAMQGPTSDPPGPYDEASCTLALQVYHAGPVNSANNGYSEQFWILTNHNSGVKKGWNAGELIQVRGYMKLNDTPAAIGETADGILQAWYFNDSTSQWVKGLEHLNMNWQGNISNVIKAMVESWFRGGNGYGFHPGNADDPNTGRNDIAPQDCEMVAPLTRCYSTNPNWGLT